MKNKFNIIAIFSLLIAVSIFYDCSNDEVENNTQEKITAQKLEFVGIEHNEILEQTFEFLKNNKSQIKTQESRESKVKLLENFLVSKIEKNEKYTAESNLLGVQNIRNTFKNINLQSKSHINLEKSVSNLSEIEKSYLNRLDIILSNVSFESEESISLNNSNISELEKEIENNINLTNNQLVTLLSATQTAKYSLLYWKENIMKWIDMGNNRLSKRDECPTDCPIQKENMKHLKDIVKADAVGAVSGAAYALAVNVIPGAGQVGYGTVIVGSAAATSVGTAAKKLIDWLWN